MFNKNLCRTLLGCVLVVLATQARAEESSRECIKLAPANQAWQITSNGQWQTLGKLSFQFASASDIMIQAAGFLAEANTPDKNVTYGLFLTNESTGVETQVSQINTRVPGNVPSTHTFRAFAPNVPGGVHTIRIKVLNTSGTPFNYYGYWIGPALFDATEATVINQSATPVNISSLSWVTVAEATLNVTSSQMLILAGWLEWSTGSAGQAVNYRFVRYAGGMETQLAAFPDAIEASTPAGQSIAYIYSAPPVGSSTIRLQAKLTTAGTAQIGPRHLWLQSTPRYAVMEGSFNGASIDNSLLPADTWTTLGTSNSVDPSDYPASLGGLTAFGTSAQKYIAGFGFGHVGYGRGPAGSPAAEVQLKTDFVDETDGTEIESGQLDAGFAGKRKLQSLMTNGDGKIGIFPTHTYRTDAEAIGICDYDTPDVPTLAGGSFQIALQADEYPFLDIHCSATNPPFDPTIQCCIPQNGCTFVCAAEAPLVMATLRSCW